MTQPSRLLAAAFAAFTIVACSSGGWTGGTPPPPSGGALVVTASQPSIPADGQASVIVHADGGTGPYVVRTTRGAFAVGGTSLTLDATPFDVEVQTCDSRLDRTCAGSTTITVLDKALTQRAVTVAFKQVEICTNGYDDNSDGNADCSDPQCPQGTACSRYGKTCGDDAKCSVCNVPNGGTVELTEASCGDGLDNDCDGLVDCADPDCGSRLCQSAVTTDGKSLTTGACVTATKTCTCTPKAEVCNDGVDNDCDGLIDCEDSNCQPVGNTLGGICDARGHACSSLQLGPSTCSVCSGNGGAAEVAEAACGDGKDNDCDGIVDCQDPDCAGLGLICDPNGKRCTSGLTCVCPGGEPTKELSCGDGLDNDCDGKIDCADTDCQGTLATNNVGKTCGAFGKVCVGTGTAAACTCRPPSGTAEASGEATCSDGVDNDCDGFADCADPTCQPGLSTAGKSCNASPAAPGYQCTVDSTCACSGNGGKPEPAGEQSCADGKDNDCDAKVDCADTQCAGRACITAGRAGMVCGTDLACSACSGNGGVAQTAETSCSDGADNDCDTKADCADSDCNGRSCTFVLADGVTQTLGACASSKCTCTPKPEVCGDGVDNDCDGKVDCVDPECQPDGINPGKACDAAGHTCTAPSQSGGTSICGTYCSGNGGTPQLQETSCFDGHDNDCDSLTDCLDPDCQANGGVTCSSTGKTCNTQGLCVCSSSESGGETTCDDHKDNDCDGLVDCADPDCSTIGARCGPNGLACTTGSSSRCMCSGNGGVAQTKETSCEDGADNDCDGARDCEDIDCRPTGTATFGLGCGNVTDSYNGFKCNALGRCVCSRGELTEATCGDLQDNDCDGARDCQDSDCQPLASGAPGAACTLDGTKWTGLTCSAGGAAASCSVCSGNGGVPEAAEASCSDGFDNDCNGLADCDDPRCANQLCLEGSTNHKCTARDGKSVCVDTSSTITLTVTAASSRLAANGASTTTVTATLKDLVGGTYQPLPGKTVTFTVDPATGGVPNGAILQSSTTTTSSGQVTATFTSSAVGGPAVVRARYDTGTLLVEGTVTIDQPQLGQLKLVSTQYQVMGARYSGFQETNLLTFQALDPANNPYPPGLDVSFTHQALGLSYVGTVETCEDGPPRTCRASARTDANGKVQVQLRSGTVAGVVSVAATASAGGGLGEAQASNLAVVGAKASGARISLNCTPYNVPGLTNHDCTNSKYGGQDSQVNCTVALADRFNNVLGVATLATFRSEAGSAGPPATTPAYDPTKPPSNQVGLGRAIDYIAVTGYKVPVDVPAFDGTNGRPLEFSRIYDDGAGCGVRTHNPRDGLSTIIVAVNGEEGFVDGSNGKPANGVYDDGEYFVDMGEPFVDTNDDGQWNDGEPWVDVNSNNIWDPPNKAWDPNTVIWAEARVLYSGFSYVEEALNVTRSVVEELGSRFYRYDVPPWATDAASYVTLAENTQLGLPAQTDVLGVYFADSNFNPPTFRTTYALSSTGPVSPKWLDDPKTIDNLGMSASQLYCSTPSPTDLAAQCADTCQASSADPNGGKPRCFVVTTVSGFNYGTWGAVEILPGSKGGSGRVTATATFNGVAIPVHVTGYTLEQ